MGHGALGCGDAADSGETPQQRVDELLVQRRAVASNEQRRTQHGLAGSISMEAPSWQVSASTRADRIDDAQRTNSTLCRLDFPSTDPGQMRAYDRLHRGVEEDPVEAMGC